MIEDSYDLVVADLPREDRRALGWRGDERSPEGAGSTDPKSRP